MIPRSAITHWNQQVPWEDIANVEQDLIITRALTDIFADEFLSRELAFRGGTALHKLYLSPQPRYSEDIDLVQINPGPIKPILFRLGEVLSYLPDKVIKPKRFNNTMLFRIQSEVPPVVQLRLKVEINCYEHFNELGLVQVPFSYDSLWAKGSCSITTYKLNELLGTKLRALYQRKKGRDLFDLAYALQNAEVNADEIIRCYRRYQAFASWNIIRCFLFLGTCAGNAGGEIEEISPASHLQMPQFEAIELRKYILDYQKKYIQKLYFRGVAAQCHKVTK